MLIDLNDYYITVFFRKFVICYCIFINILCISFYYICTYKMKHTTHCMMTHPSRPPGPLLLKQTAVFQRVGS